MNRNLEGLTDLKTQTPETISLFLDSQIPSLPDQRMTMCLNKVVSTGVARLSRYGWHCLCISRSSTQEVAMFTPWCRLGSTLHYPSRGAAAADCLLNLCTDVTCIQQNHVHVGHPVTQSRNTNTETT